MKISEQYMCNTSKNNQILVDHKTIMRHWIHSIIKLCKNDISKNSVKTTIVISFFLISFTCTSNNFLFHKRYRPILTFEKLSPFAMSRRKKPNVPSLCYQRFEHLFGFNLYFQDMCVGPSWGNQNAQRKRIYCQISDDKVKNL